MIVKNFLRKRAILIKAGIDWQTEIDRLGWMIISFPANWQYIYQLFSISILSIQKIGFVAAR